ncbi:hypothetical protein ACSBR1_009272 [Camellia fascicularis]
MRTCTRFTHTRRYWLTLTGIHVRAVSGRLMGSRSIVLRVHLPILTVEKPTVMPDDYLIAPPAVKCPPGKPKWKRIPSRGEVMLRIQCNRYGKMGNHNRKTCKEPIYPYRIINNDII